MSEEQARLGDLIADRRTTKADRLAAGVHPHPVGITVRDRLVDVHAAFADRLEPGEESDTEVAVAGRMVLRRLHGKLAFLVLREGDTDLQVMVSRHEVDDP